MWGKPQTWAVVLRGPFGESVYYTHLTREEAYELARRKNDDKAVKGTPFRAVDMGTTAVPNATER